MDSGEPAARDLPRISIVTPSFNQAPFLEQTLRSVLLQGYPNLEYMVFDGGSRDGSVEILQRYSDHLTHWQSEPDRGQAHAINQGLERASGEILAWLNSDDLLLPNALHRVAKLYQEIPEAAAWIGACYRIDGEGRLLSVVHGRGLEQKSIADWGSKGFFYQPSCFFSAEAWHEVGPLDVKLRYAFDVDLWIRLAGAGAFAATQDVLSAAVIHDEAKTQAERSGMHAETIAVQVAHGFREAAEARLAHVAARAAGRRGPQTRLLGRFWRELKELVRSPPPRPDRQSEPQFPLEEA